MTLQNLYDGVQLCNRRLIQTYKEEVEKIKNSGFLMSEDGVQKIVQESLEIYRKDRESAKKDIKEYGFDIMVLSIAGKLAKEKMATDFAHIKIRAQELENEEGIKEFITEGEHKDYKKQLWVRNVRLMYTWPIKEELEKKIASHISKVLEKEVKDEEENRSIM